LPSMA